MNREQTWGIVRVILGILQIMGATCGIALYFHTGVSQLTVAAAVGTGILTLTSSHLFRERKVK
jgi:hypothetical protein